MRIAVFLLIFLAFLPGIAFCSQSEDLTLHDALAKAFENNRTIDSAGKAILEAEHNFSSTQKERLPKVNMGYSYMYLGNDVNLTDTDPSTGESYIFPLVTKNNYTWNTGINMPLYTGGVQELTELIAKLGIDISRVKLIQAKNELALNVKCYYFTVLRSEKLIDYFEQNLKSYEKHEAQSVSFNKQGLVAKNAVLEARVEKANAEQELTSARNEAEISRCSLNTVMGVEINSGFNLKDGLSVKPLEMSYDDCIFYAKKHNPDLLVFSFAKQQAQSAVKLEKAHYNPTLNLSANYYLYGDTPGLRGNEMLPNNLLVAMLSINWELFDWGQKNESAKARQMQYEQVVNSEKLAQDNITLKIREAYSQIRTAEKNVATAITALDLAKENLRISNLRYSEQVTNSTEVLDAITALKKAEFNHCSALYNYNIAMAKLEYAIGADMEQIIKAGK
ncbi:MAG: TolC family protein [Firmicutes bacterium]|nr:TolC family protein [Bacillota bacterium]